MRIAVLSDIHGNLAALDAVLADVDRRGADLMVNLGDALSGPLQPAATANRLMPLDLPTIRGNHERQLLALPPEQMGASDACASAELDERHRAWLASLPATLRPASDVLLCHGTPDSDLTYFLETVTSSGAREATEAEVEHRVGQEDAALILCGHTHIPRSRRLAGGRLVVNPGSIGLPAYRDDRPHPHVMEAGSPHARYALCKRDEKGRWSAELIAVAYDWSAASQAAEARGRSDWAKALRTGRI